MAAGAFKAQAQSNTRGPGLQAANQSFLVTEGVQPWELGKTSLSGNKENKEQTSKQEQNTPYIV